MSIVNGTIEEPAYGVWVADLDFELSDQVTGEFEFGGVTWSGTVVDKVLIEGGLKKAKIIGGLGKPSQRVASRSFKDATLQRILSSLLTNTDLTGTAAELDVAAYVVLGGPLGLVISKLAQVYGLDWYVTRAGSIGLQKRTGREVDPPRVATDMGNGMIFQFTSCSAIAPGDTYQGQAVRHLRWRLSPNQFLVEVSFSELTKREPSLGYELTYSGRIVRQHPDGAPIVDVLIGNDLGIREVPLVVGGPFRVKVAKDDLCKVGFTNGDPRQPYVMSMVQKGSKRVAREGDTISLGRLAFVPGSGTDVLTWTPPPTEDIPIPVPVVISAGGVDIYGVIDQGSDEVKLP